MSDSKYFPAVTKNALETFENIQENIHVGSATGRSMAEESMPCECKYDSELDNPSLACGDDNRCINRMMFMECMVQDCPCGHLCRNRRFQLGQHASVDVISTEKKGYGLRVLTNLPKNSFIMEYIGEVIPQNEFIKRTKKYDTEGYDHYYFMTLKKDEIIDATKKGCLARFINHSCNPNCVTQKWVIGKKMRIGIFTCRAVTAGEELTFDYKFERYGATAQKCYCGESICKGYIGVTMDDTSSDEEQIEKTTTKSQPLNDPSKVQWFVKRMLNSVGKLKLVNDLLDRLLLINDKHTQGRDLLKMIIRLHGLKMLKFWLGEWKHNEPIIIKVLQVLEKLPLANRNGLDDCKLFNVVEVFVCHENQEISSLSQYLLDQWNQLKTVYRIPKRVHVDLLPETKPIDEEQVIEKQDIPMPLISDYIEKKPIFESSREYFDPDNDYIEYLSMNATLKDITAKINFSIHSSVPTTSRPVSIDYYHSKQSHKKSYPSVSDTNLIHTNIATFTNLPTPTHSLHQEDHTEINAPNTQNYHDYYNYYYYYYYGIQPPLNHWQIATTENGLTYYYNTLTNQTQWETPQELLESTSMIKSTPPPPPPPPPPPTFDIVSNEEEIKKQASCNHLLTPKSGSIDSNEEYLNEASLKIQISKVVTKYLSSKSNQGLWKGDKCLFKDLARKVTHHIVNKELQSGRKIKSIDTGLRLKIEKFIDMHSIDYVTKIQRKP